jgi:predicted amidohydrolase
VTLVAAIQLEPRQDAWDRVRALVARARERGAKVVALPETFLEDESLEPWHSRLATLAHESGVALVAGTLREHAQGDARPYPTSVVFDAAGREVFRYRKVHLFDVDLPGGPSEKESASLRPGPTDGVRPFDLPELGRCGLGICYDLRFPELWRSLSAAGARTLFVPSSFAEKTGKAHWHVLLRARAIENLAWVVAPGQVGRKPDGRVRFGHSLVVDPWGTVVAEAGEGEGMAIADIDAAEQERARRGLPCLEHRRI